MANKLLNLAAVTGALAAAQPSDAATMLIDNPVYGVSNVALVSTGINNDPGVTYNSMEWNVFSSLAGHLYNNSTLNQSNYGSVGALMADWTLGISGGATNNWTPTIGASNNIITTHGPGIPNVNYDSMPFGEDQQLISFIPHSQLEKNGIDGYQWNGDANDPTNDWGVGINSATQNNMFVGYQGAAGFSADGNEYKPLGTTVPEPSSTALVGLGLVGLAFRRNRKE